jgi:hypothetical protein
MKTNSAVFGVSLIESMLAFSIMLWIHVLTSHRLEVNRWLVVFAVFPIYYANQYFLVARGSGVAFEKEFSLFPKSKRIILRSAAIGIFIATLTILFSSIAEYRGTFGVG